MKKRNLVLHTAIAAAMLSLLGSAQATTVTATAPVFAKELLLGTSPAATALTMPTITVVANAAVPANSILFVYVKLNGASVSTMPTVTGTAATIVSQGDGSGPAGAGSGLLLIDSRSAGSTTATANPAAVGAGVDYVVFQIQNNATAIGIGGTLATITGLAVNNAVALLTAPITATASVGIGAPTSRFGALPTTASNFDATSTPVNVATNAQGITLTSVASTNAGKIDLAATPAATAFDASAISTNTISLGAITATDGSAVQANGVAYTAATQVTGGNKLSAVITAPAGFFAPLGTTGQLWLQSPACTTAGATGAAGTALTGSPSTVFATAALAAAATSVTLTATALPPSGAAINVCMGVTKTIAITEAAPTSIATLIHAATTVDSSETSTTSLYSVLRNGAMYDVRSYVPKSVVGYTSFIRMINTGSIAGAVVSGQFINADGSSVGTSFPLTTLAAGGSITMSSTDIEAIMGAPVGGVTARPRLRLTAPTNGLSVQSQLSNNASGVFTDFNGAQ